MTDTTINGGAIADGFSILAQALAGRANARIEADMARRQGLLVDAQAGTQRAQAGLYGAQTQTETHQQGLLDAQAGAATAQGGLYGAQAGYANAQTAGQNITNEATLRQQAALQSLAGIFGGDSLDLTDPATRAQLAAAGILSGTEPGALLGSTTFVNPNAYSAPDLSNVLAGTGTVTDYAHTPDGQDAALANDIAKSSIAARSASDVATIQGGTDLGVAGVQADAARYGHDKAAGADLGVARIGADADRDVARTGLKGDRYAADTSAAAARHGHDASADAARYGHDADADASIGSALIEALSPSGSASSRAAARVSPGDSAKLAENLAAALGENYQRIDPAVISLLLSTAERNFQGHGLSENAVRDAIAQVQGMLNSGELTEYNPRGWDSTGLAIGENGGAPAAPVVEPPAQPAATQYQDGQEGVAKDGTPVRRVNGAWVAIGGGGR